MILTTPRSNLGGIVDPRCDVLFLYSLTLPQAAGSRVYESGEANALAGIQFLIF